MEKKKKEMLITRFVIIVVQAVDRACNDLFVQSM
jgi:hypothetical protein